MKTTTELQIQVWLVAIALITLVLFATKNFDEFKEETTTNFNNLFQQDIATANLIKELVCADYNQTYDPKTNSCTFREEKQNGKLEQLHRGIPL